MTTDINMKQLKADALEIFCNGFACSESVIFSLRKHFQDLLFFIFFLLLFDSLCCPVSGCAANICSPVRTGCRTTSCLYVYSLHLSVSVTQ